MHNESSPFVLPRNSRRAISLVSMKGEDVCDGSISKCRLAISIILIVWIFRIVRGVSIIAIDELYKPQIVFAKLSFVIFEEAKHRESMG